MRLIQPIKVVPIPRHCTLLLLTAEVLHAPVVRAGVPGVPRVPQAAPRAHHLVQPLELLLEAAGVTVLWI